MAKLARLVALAELAKQVAGVELVAVVERAKQAVVVGLAFVSQLVSMADQAVLLVDLKDPIESILG